MKNKTTILLALGVLFTGSASADEHKSDQAVDPASGAVRLVVKSTPPEVANEPKTDKPAAADAKDKAEATARARAEGAKPDAVADKEAKPVEKESDPKQMLAELRKLENELQKARRLYQQEVEGEQDTAGKKTAADLDSIILPQNPTRKQCEAYIDELRTATEGRRSFSTSDPATKKLKEIPAEHADLLITEIAKRTSLHYCANYALRGIDPEKFRSRFVETLDENPDNIGIIVMYGWCADASSTIINYMKNADGSVAPAWFQAAVEIGEPSLYPKLHEVTTESRYAGQFIAMLEVLPDYDLAHTVDVCWRRSREGKLSVNTNSFIPKVAAYGNVEALGSMIDQLQSSTSNYLIRSSTSNIRRTNVLRLIEYRGSNKEILAWYKTNKDKLVFDQSRKRFIILEDF